MSHNYLDWAKHQNRHSSKSIWQGRNHVKMLAATSAMGGRICPLGLDRVKASENLGATSVSPVAPVDTSLKYVFTYLSGCFICLFLNRSFVICKKSENC